MLDVAEKREVQRVGFREDLLHAVKAFGFSHPTETVEKEGMCESGQLIEATTRWHTSETHGAHTME